MGLVRRLPELTDFDLRLLRVFAAVVKAGGFTGAELALNKGKSAISADIAALEARLGAKLCSRGRSGFALTPKGEEIYNAMRGLFGHLTDFRDRVGEIVSKVGGELNIAIDDNIALFLQAELSQIIEQFSGRLPEVCLSINSTSPEHVAQLVIEGSADVGLSAVPRPIPEIDFTPVFKETMVLCCGAKHPLFVASQDELDDERIFSHGFVDVVCRQAEELLSSTPQMKVRARAGTMSSRALLIASGRYLGFLPHAMAKGLVEQGTCRILAYPRLSYVNNGFAIMRPENQSYAAKQFVQQLTLALSDRLSQRPVRSEQTSLREVGVKRWTKGGSLPFAFQR